MKSSPILLHTALLIQSQLDGLIYWGQVVQKLLNNNPGLKFNRSIYFSCIEMFPNAYVLCSLRLFKLKAEGQAV